MPEWLEQIESSMKRGGVREPYGLLNAMGIKHGSKTVVDEKGAKEKMSSYGRRMGKKRRAVSAAEAGDAMAAHKGR